MAGNKKKTKRPTDMLLVQSKVKEFVRSYDMMCSSDLIEELNNTVGDILEKAVDRAAANGRKTARAADV